MFQLLFALAGLVMSAVVIWTFARPLWKGGFTGLAILVGLLSTGLVGGLVYLTLSFVR